MENTDNHIKHVRKLQLRHSMSSDYPKNYEITTVTKGGLHIFIRPIKPGDTLLLQRFWKVLSPKTTYYRFSSFSKKLTRDFLQWLTVIDCQRETALVAIEYTGKEKRFLGMARLTGRMGDKVAEIAV
ncbi:hypothetical protein KKA14_12535, partial [bacterium]|nr:hypothetical protein [bacterium]